MLRNGQQIKISAPGLGKCYGRVDDVRPINQLPAIEDVDALAREAGYTDSGAAARSILGECGASHIAIISYRMTPTQLVAFAVFAIGGEWFDRAGQPLTIEEVTN